MQSSIIVGYGQVETVTSGDKQFQVNQSQSMKSRLHLVGENALKDGALYSYMQLPREQKNYRQYCTVFFLTTNQKNYYLAYIHREPEFPPPPKKKYMLHSKTYIIAKSINSFKGVTDGVVCARFSDGVTTVSALLTNCFVQPWQPTPKKGFCWKHNHN